jgi:hypothetical protein
MKRTCEQLKEVDEVVASLYNKIPTLKNTKFAYAYKRFFEKNLKLIFDEIREEILDVRINNALEDKETKEILVDSTNERGYKFDREGLKNVMKEEKKIFDKFNKKEIEIEPYFTDYIPEEIEEHQREFLKGLIIK